MFPGRRVCREHRTFRKRRTLLGRRNAGRRRPRCVGGRERRTRLPARRDPARRHAGGQRFLAHPPATARIPRHAAGPRRRRIRSRARHADAPHPGPGAARRRGAGRRRARRARPFAACERAGRIRPAPAGASRATRRCGRSGRRRARPRRRAHRRPGRRPACLRLPGHRRSCRAVPFRRSCRPSRRRVRGRRVCRDVQASAARPDGTAAPGSPGSSCHRPGPGHRLARWDPRGRDPGSGRCLSPVRALLLGLLLRRAAARVDELRRRRVGFETLRRGLIAQRARLRPLAELVLLLRGLLV